MSPSALPRVESGLTGWTGAGRLHFSDENQECLSVGNRKWLLRKVNVVCVLGTSYCGSTLLNLMLGAHPDIYGGSELHSFIRDGEIHKVVHGSREYNTLCQTCGESCRYWTPERIGAMNAEGLYQQIADLFDCNTIVDSSKTPLWFERIIRCNAQYSTCFLPVVLVKHPIRHATSLLLNKVREATQDPEEQKAYFQNRKQVMSALNDYLQKWLLATYHQMQEFLRDKEALLIRYEDLVLSPRETLMPVLDALGLPYDEKIEDCYSCEHHPIGGNSGTYYQITKHSPCISDGIGVRSAFYKDLKGVRLDNKYLDLLQTEEIESLNRHPVVATICGSFGYDDLSA